MTDGSTATTASEWQTTSCILCSCNCGIEIRLGGPDGRSIERVRGDKAHPSSKGYTCEKPLRLDLYQNARDRLTHPLRRRPDGTFERIDWDTAIREVAGRLSAIRDEHGTGSVFYYGGGGQANHLPGFYATSTLSALGVQYRSNALAQEKTGEMWVRGKMFGAGVHGDFENCEVGVFVGKNPWHSHGIPHARTTVRDIARDPKRTLVVIDPRASETAEIADIHLRPKPGTDAWLLSAILGVLVQEDLVAHEWLDVHAEGAEEVLGMLKDIPVSAYCEISGVAEEEVRNTVRKLAAASSVALFEDLGVQMAPHSTLCSYLNNLLVSLTGNVGKPGGMNPPVPFVSISGLTSGGLQGGPRAGRQSPVAGARIISGLVPCNVIAEEILTDHPDRYRAMLVESSNPAHSLADSQKMREALQALDLLVVIDVAMTETARLADYVLPVPSQYEKWEASFFNLEWPANYFHLRRPLLDPPPGSDLLPEAEIHARLCEALGAFGEEELAPLREAAAKGRMEYAVAFLTATTANPRLTGLAPAIIYRTLGPTMPEGAAAAAGLWGAAQLCVRANPAAVRRAGIEGSDFELGDKLFDAVMASPSGLIFSVDTPAEAWTRMGTAHGKINLAIPEMLGELGELTGESAPAPDPDFPFVLSAGERRSFTANTIYRDPAWRKKDAAGALRVNPDDAVRIGAVDGGRVRLTTRRNSVEVPVEISVAMLPGHVSLPNGYGLDYPDSEGRAVVTGVPPNELTASEDRDWLAGTPWHKHVPARVEAIS